MEARTSSTVCPMLSIFRLRSAAASTLDSEGNEESDEILRRLVSLEGALSGVERRLSVEELELLDDRGAPELMAGEEEVTSTPSISLPSRYGGSSSSSFAIGAPRRVRS